MTIDDKLTEHVRAALAGIDSVREVKMFGGRPRNSGARGVCDE